MVTVFFNVNKIILLILLILTFRSSYSSFIFFVVFIEPLTCLWRAKLKIFVKVLTAGPSISKRSFFWNSTTVEYCHFSIGVCMYISFWDYYPSWELYVIHLLFFPQQSYFMKTYSACVTLADLQYLERERNGTRGIEMFSTGPCREDSGPWSKVMEKGMQGQAPSPWPHSLCLASNIWDFKFLFPTVRPLLSWQVILHTSISSLWLPFSLCVFIFLKSPIPHSGRNTTVHFLLK